MIYVSPSIVFRGAPFRIRSDDPLPQVEAVMAYGRSLPFAQADAHNLQVRVPRNWPRNGSDPWPIGTYREPLLLLGRTWNLALRPDRSSRPLVRVEIRRIGRPLPPGVTRDPTNPAVLRSGALRCWEEIDGNIRCGPRGLTWYVLAP